MWPQNTSNVACKSFHTCLPQEGGLELLVDDADENSGRELGRLRVRRCAYSPGARPRETSERAILSNLRRDWEMVQGWRQPK